MRLRKPGRARGNMFVEVLIVLAIIGLMVLIAIPVYSGRGEEARTDQAVKEIERLAQAEKQVAEQYGAYVPLQVLDDMPATTEVKSAIDSIGNEPAEVRLIPTNLTNDAEPPAEQESVATLAEEWSGPYAQTKRVNLGAAQASLELAEMDAETLRNDFPLDPWGTPYRFYSPLGIVGSAAATTDTQAAPQNELSDGVVTTDDDRFATYAIVSYGPNRLSDSMTENDDDIIYLFEEGDAAEIDS